jgi:hypothetical protein
MSGQLNASAALPPRKGVVPRASLEDMEKRKFLTLPGLEISERGKNIRREDKVGKSWEK